MAGELETLLEQFATRWGLDHPRLNAQDRYFLIIDGCLRITLFQIGHRIYLEGHPGALPKDSFQGGERLSEILRMYLARLKQHEEILSLDPVSDDLLLFRCLPVQTLNLGDLEKAIETFSNRLEFWVRALSHESSRLTPLPMHIVLP